MLENQHKRSLHSDIGRLKLLIPWIGTVSLDRIPTGTLQPWIEHRQKGSAAVGTITHGLKVVRRILNLATNEWVDEHGLTWLLSTPRIKLLSDTNKRKPYPLNRVALAAVERQRGVHPVRVFTYRGEPVTRMLNSAWMRARVGVGLPQVRVHDLRHTFGRRLRHAGVRFEGRQDLLGHRSARVTTHYSATKLSTLLEAASSICVAGNDQQRPEIVLRRRLPNR